MLVVLHLSPQARSNLAPILARAGRLPADEAVDGAAIEPGRILCAPPDHHLVVRDGRARVVRGPHENLHRPSVDVRFRSAALSADGRTCGVVLSGALDDGTSGMRAIQQTGGLTVVQEPGDALVPSMPEHVLQALEPDHVLPADDIGRRMPELLRAPRRKAAPAVAKARQSIAQEAAMSTLEPGSTDQEPPGDRSPFGCPDCGGVLWEVNDHGAFRFRCRVGHAYSARALMSAGAERLDDALWAALRALEEQEALAQRLLERPWAGGADAARARLEERLLAARSRAETLREFLLAPGLPSAPGGDDGPEPGGQSRGGAAVEGAA